MSAVAPLEAEAPFDARVHLFAHAEECSESVLALRALLQAQLQKSEAHRLEMQDFCTDASLVRFLIARNFDVQASYELLAEALDWRILRNPASLRAAEFEPEARTGKIYCPGKDQWGRPILIFDNSVQNTTDVDNQMRFLAFSLEFCIREMNVNANKEHFVDKYLVFMHLENFSFFNIPPFKATRETITMLTTCYPERLGHCILFKPPAIFKTFFNGLKGFLDAKTAAKIVFITGDTSDGSDNDVTLCSLIGPHWRDTTGADKERIEEGCSPGYDHKLQWTQLIQKEQAHFGGCTSESSGEIDAEMTSISDQKPETLTPESDPKTAVSKPGRKPKGLIWGVLAASIAVLVAVVLKTRPGALKPEALIGLWRQALLVAVGAICFVVFAHKSRGMRGSAASKVFHSFDRRENVEILVTSDRQLGKYFQVAAE